MNHALTAEEFANGHPYVAGFFDDFKKFVLPDLTRLRRDVRPDPRGQQGCTIPTAMLAFAVIDFVGFLIRPSPITTKERDDTSANIGFCLSNGAHLFPIEYQDNTELLIHLFRHGMMHQVFPKAAAIAKEMPPRVDLPLIRREPPEGGILVLNADRLVDDLLEALAFLEERVRSETNGKLASLMDQKICFLQKVSGEKLEKLTKEGFVRL